MTWEVRAVDKTGVVQGSFEVDPANPRALNIERLSLGLNGDEGATLKLNTLHPDAALLDIFSHELQFWHVEVLVDEAGVPLVDELGEQLVVKTMHAWLRPTVINADRSGQTDEITVECDSLFTYLHDVVVGGPLPNHITSPHEDSAAVGSPPAAWTVTGAVEDAAIVDNNATFWDIAKAIQLNNGEPDQDAYAYQRITVTADMAGVPMFAGAEVYIADGVAGAPAWGGQAMSGRGLMIHRLDGSTLAPVSEPQIARITDETPRNQVVELFTPGVLPLEGEVVEVRLYAPAAWTVWRYAHLRDDRAIAADRVDKSVAVQTLVTAAQDTALGWTDRDIGTDVVDLGEVITMSWPWWRRDIIGEQIEDLANSFEFVMDFPDVTPGSAVRNVKIRPQIGSDLTAEVTLTKEHFVNWSLGVSRPTTANRVIRQGSGSGAARMERWEQDLTTLGGQVRAVLTFGAPGELLATMRDTAREQLGRMKVKPKLIRARVFGDLALTIRPGDTVAADMDHGWAQFAGDVRVMHKDLDPAAITALLDLEPV